MAVIFVPNYQAIQVTVRQLIGTRAVTNVLHFDHGSIPSEVEVENFAEEFLNSWGTYVIPHQTDYITTVGVDARSLATQESPIATVNYPVPLAGEYTATNPAPNSVAFVATLRTSIPGRSGRGRMFLAAPQLASDGANYVNSTWGSNIIGGLEALRGHFDDGLDQPWCVYSKFSNGAPRTLGRLSKVTTVVARNLRIDSQRRRLPD